MDDLEEFEDKRINFIKNNDLTSKQNMMELIYSAITEKKHGALKHDAPTSEKIEGVQTILNFFKEIEDYKKCAVLKTIIQDLSNEER